MFARAVWTSAIVLCGLRPWSSVTWSYPVSVDT
jgi:hypothetical protein